MPPLRLAFAAALLVALPGCSVPSLNPLYTDADIIFDARLLGDWRHEADNSRTVIRQANPNSYDIAHRDPDRTTFRYTGHLVKLGNHTFLNLFPQRDDKRADDIGYLPVNNFYRISLEGDTMRFGGIRASWVQDALAQKKITPAHVAFRPPAARQDSIILTGSTAAMQDFVRQIAAIDEAFYDSKLQRRR